MTEERHISNAQSLPSFDPCQNGVSLLYWMTTVVALSSNSNSNHFSFEFTLRTKGRSVEDCTGITRGIEKSYLNEAKFKYGELSRQEEHMYADSSHKKTK